MRAKRKQTAFTIVELLLAATITVGIVLVLGTMFGSLTNSANRANNRIDAFRDARAALQLMTRDLSNLVTAKPAVYFEIKDDSSAGPNVRHLYLLTAAKNKPSGAAATSPGDVCAVKYYCAWDSAKRAYSLHRYFMDSDLTFKAFQANLSGSSLNWTSDTALFMQAPSANGPQDEAIADYVWNLQVTAFDRAGNVINPTTNNNVTTTAAPYQCDPSGSTNTLPASVEITFKAISPTAARTVIAATKSWGNPWNVWMIADNPNLGTTEKTYYKNMVLPYTYDFWTRVDLK